MTDVSEAYLIYFCFIYNILISILSSFFLSLSYSSYPIIVLFT